ncbi:MAG: hypothetical protein LAT68_00575 [Cyclobacteriaceae bacterium]|nr:hypothetical protein [Cyclobacteriaceae bacterium]MCH8514797.1 hypothetical protein [Cyclobacteriaceae bacterium]
MKKRSFYFYVALMPVLFFGFIFFSCSDDDSPEPILEEEPDREETLFVDAGSDQVVDYNTIVHLDGSETRDDEGLPITYSWEVISFPGDEFLDEEEFIDIDQAVAQFRPQQVGAYVFRLTASTEFEEKSSTTQVEVEAEPVELQGNFDEDIVLERTTPRGMVDYYVPSFFRVRGTANMTVMPGVIIEMRENSSGAIVDDASFTAEGTEEHMIQIKGREATKGYWRGINFSTSNPDNKLYRVHLSDGGANNGNHRGMVVMHADGAALHMENALLTNAQNAGLDLNIVTGGGIRNLTHVNNDYKNNEFPVNAVPRHFHYLDKESDYTGNDNDRINNNNALTPLAGSDADVITWQNLGVPYHLGGAFTNGPEWVIEAGVILVMGSDGILRSNGGSQGTGAIKWEGTLENPIRIVGREDLEGFWNGIFVSSNRGNTISHVEIQNAGANVITSGAVRCSVLVNGGRLNIDNAKFIRGRGDFAIYGRSNPTLTIGENISLEDMPGAATSNQ